jgi:hypothetical protein
MVVRGDDLQGQTEPGVLGIEGVTLDDRLL